MVATGHDVNWVVVAKFGRMLKKGGKGSWWPYRHNVILGLQMMDD